MQFGDPLSVTTPSDTEVLIERLFSAPPHLVYACYTQPPLIRRWLTGPTGWTMPHCEYDPRLGGRYRFEWHGPDDGRLAVSGEIKRIEPLRHIDSTEQFDSGVMGPPYGSTLDFLLEGMGTRLVNRISYTSREHRDLAVGTGMAEGMEFSFSSLDRVLREEQE